MPPVTVRESFAVGPKPAWVPDELYPFPSRFLEVGGHRLHYLDEGEGPALLLLHGNPTWSFLYRAIVRRLRDEFRCVAPDYPGFGLSRARAGFDFRPRGHAEAVAALVERLDLRNLVIFGQDWGGPIGFHVAARNSARVAGFVIGNTWAWPLNGDPHFERFSRILGGAGGQDRRVPPVRGAGRLLRGEPGRSPRRDRPRRGRSARHPPGPQVPSARPVAPEDDGAGGGLLGG